MDVAAYLRRIGYHGPVAPSADTLRALHVAHLLAVPFENLSIHIGEPIVLDDAALFEKIVERRRGGFCYELNGLFAGLLRELGFDVSMLSAGVMGAAGEFGPEFDHMTLLVRLDEPWLADVGFGDCFREPLRLREDEDQVQGRDRFRLSLDRATDRWLLTRTSDDNAAKPQYRFTTTPHRMAEYTGMCEFHQTSPESPFTRQRLCTIATAEGRVTLAGMRLATSRGDTKEDLILPDERKYAAALHQSFGIVLPARI